jgi:hypothetical protein
MRYGRWVALLLCLLLPHSSAKAQAADAGADLGANAALKYWEAFGLLPALSKDQEKLLERWHKVPLDAAAQKLIDRSHNSRVYLQRGAKLRHCDWSLNYEDGIQLLVPHAPKSRALARLAALHARHEFEQGHGKAGVEDVIALLKMARHLKTDPIMLIQLVACSIEATAIEAAAPYLPELKPAVRADLAAVLEALPAAPTLRQLVLKEKELGPVWLLRHLKELERAKQGSWQIAWKEFLGLMKAAERESPEQKIEREGVEAITTYKQAVKMLEDGLPSYEELAKLSALPGKELDARFPEFIKTVKAANPPVGALLPAMDRFVASQRRNQTQLALFKAALAVVQGGPDKLKDIRDPFGDGPFEYRALDKGFELRSRLIVNGQPVMLTVGKGKQE